MATTITAQMVTCGVGQPRPGQVLQAHVAQERVERADGRVVDVAPDEGDDHERRGRSGRKNAVR